MAEADRRTFLQTLAAGGALSALPGSIGRALAIPANNATGTIHDVQHIVILMQENRAFDHYLGTLRGVRGFSDPRAVKLPSGKPVWYQPNGSSYVLPFHPDAANLGLTFIQDLAHDWTSTHAAWNGGRYDNWVPSKGTTTMAYLTRNDIPFHYALADAFTICDAYHCSLLGPTDPNRYYMWTGWVGNDGKGGGPVIDNTEAGYDWSTYPERLQNAGITWRVYQDVGIGLTAGGSYGYAADPYVGNYGDNALLYFHKYELALPGTPLADRARTGTEVLITGTLFDRLRADVTAGTLPQVSWIVAPEAFTEHPNWPANYGAYYVSQVLDVLTSNPAVWSKTVLFLTYDENDGFFDHMVPLTPPQTRAEGMSTVAITNEIYPGSVGVPNNIPAGPYGLGVRVPMFVISPWSKGGFVNSQVFDHTSLIRFIEQRFGTSTNNLTETNITAWRRAVAGDLTSAFDFAHPNGKAVTLPSTAGYQPPDNLRHSDYVPAVPAVQHLPAQETGLRWARPLPYQPYVRGWINTADGSFAIQFANRGTAGMVFQVRSGNSGDNPTTYTVTPAHQVTDHFPVTAKGRSEYDLSVYGPNGFLRAFRGSVSAPGHASLDVSPNYDLTNNAISLAILNRGAGPAEVLVTEGYTGKLTKTTLATGASVTLGWSLAGSYGWYNLLVKVSSDSRFRQQYAGHLETGRVSASDPVLGGAKSAF